MEGHCAKVSLARSAIVIHVRREAAGEMDGAADPPRDGQPRQPMAENLGSDMHINYPRFPGIHRATPSSYRLIKTAVYFYTQRCLTRFHHTLYPLLSETPSQAQSVHSQRRLLLPTRVLRF